MKNKSYAQIKAIEQKNKQRLLQINPELDEESGIYFLLREDEDGFKYAYIGQAKHILTRLASHLTGYQHIDLSLKKHKFYDKETNPYGWEVHFLHFPLDELDSMEQHFIKTYATAGYQLRNKTSGSQGEGKKQIDEYKPHRGYRDGLIQGRKNASREIANLFDKHLNYSKKSDKPNKNQERAAEKFEDFLNYYKSTEQIEREKYGRVVSSGNK